MEPVCNQGLCGKRAAKGDVFCKAHRRLKSRAYHEGLRVVFAPSPVSAALYSRAPLYGSKGAVVSMSLGRKCSTFLPGPGGGLLYVRWDTEPGPQNMQGAFVMGVSPRDLYRGGK